MDWETRRLLELAGIKRRGTPDRLLLEEEGDDDAGGGDDAGGDPFDDGGDDPFGGDDGGSDGGGDDGGDNREPPEELSASDIQNYGSPRFLDVETNLANFFNDSKTSAAAAAQHLETYPGKAIPEEEATPAKEEANESVNRNRWLVMEANRLLLEAEEEGAAADEFDMERYATEVANYMDTVTTTQDIEAGVFNAARQMILNNFGEQTEQEFIDMLAAVTKGKWDFLPTSIPDYTQETPVAVGASGDGGA